MPLKFLIALIASFVVAVGSAQAANPPEVQIALEKAASALKGQNDGVVMVSETVITDLALEIRYKAAPNVALTLAAEKVKSKAASWALAMCASSTVPTFLRRTGTTLTITFETAPNVYEIQSRVEPTSCPENSAQQPRTINGKLLYPRPSRDSALALIMGKLKFELLDFASAKIECTDVSQAVWVKQVLQPRQYGYVVRCEMNAKNAFGGYTGYESRWYYFNGPTFAETERDPKMGLVEP